MAGNRIADLILARGDALARGQEQSGAIWGNAVQNIGQTFAQLPGQIQAGREADRAAQAKAGIAARRKALWAGQTPSPQAIVAEYGPEEGLKIVTGLKALQTDPGKDFERGRTILRDVMLGMNALDEETRAEAYPGIRQNLVSKGIITAADAPEQYTPEFWKQATSYGKEPEKPKPVGTREIRTRNADGSEKIDIVEDKPGFSATSAAPAAALWKPGASGTTPQERLALQLGYKDPATGRPMTEKLTEAQANAADRRAAAATRFTEPKTSEQIWVVRNGVPTPIAKGTAQAGDVPYDEVAVRQKNGPTDTKAEDNAAEVVRLATALKNHAGFGGAFGVVSARMPTFSQNTADAEVLLDSLKSRLTLENMGVMKGVLSDSDMKIIKAASTSLNERMSETAAKAELDRLITVLNKVKSAPAAPSGPETPEARAARLYDELSK